MVHRFSLLVLLLAASLPFGMSCGDATPREAQEEAESQTSDNFKTAVAAGAFDGLQTKVASQGFDNFQAAVASDRHYEVYWLGREFEVAGLVFRGPNVGEPGDPGYSDPRDSLTMFYLADDDDKGRGGSIELTLYSEEAWAALANRSTTVPNSTSEEVELLGVNATLTTRVEDGIPYARWLTVRVGETVIRAVTSAYVVPRGFTEQPNPLMDEELFLAVMEEIVRYPV